MAVFLLKLVIKIELMPKISTSFSELHYEKSGKGPAMMLIHGFPESGTLWNNIIPNLDGVTLFIPDLPGAGESSLKRPCSIDEMALGINEMLITEGIGEVIIAGHSMGGYVALSFARQFPEKVKGLSLVHSSPDADDEERLTKRRKAIELIKNGGKEPFLRQTVGALFEESFKNDHPDVIEQQIQRALQLNEACIINYYEAMMARASHSDMLENAKYAIQWVLGDSDNLIPLSKILPQAQKPTISFVSLYDKCGHMSMIEHPEKLAYDFKTFIDFCYH